MLHFLHAQHDLVMVTRRLGTRAFVPLGSGVSVLICQQDSQAGAFVICITLCFDRDLIAFLALIVTACSDMSATWRAVDTCYF